MEIPRRRLSLAQRGAELEALGWPNSKVKYRQGREMRFSFSLAPTPMSRSYRCLLKVPRAGFPEMIVLEPDLKLLAGGRQVPHVYPHKDKGTKLCLWLPSAGEWNSSMRFDETYLPWTAEWLDYFEEWLETDTWVGGGAHPEPPFEQAESPKETNSPGRLDLQNCESATAASLSTRTAKV